MKNLQHKKAKMTMHNKSQLYQLQNVLRLGSGWRNEMEREPPHQEGLDSRNKQQEVHSSFIATAVRVWVIMMR